jgi:hypothetical protein
VPLPTAHRPRRLPDPRPRRIRPPCCAAGPPQVPDQRRRAPLARRRRRLLVAARLLRPVRPGRQPRPQAARPRRRVPRLLLQPRRAQGAHPPGNCLSGPLPSFRGMASLEQAFLNDNAFDSTPYAKDRTK